jgi:hypothetical protein
VRSRRLRFFACFLALAVAAALLTLRGQNAFGVRPITPAVPKAFMRGVVRQDLTDLANRLIRLPYRSIATPPEGPTVATMSLGWPPAPVPAELDSALRRHGFHYTRIKASDSVAVLVSIQGRAAYRYTYSVRPLGPPYTQSSTLTEEDFSEWAELQRIARFGLDSSECARNRIVFEPTIVYPYLQQAIGDSQLAAFASRPSPDDITPSERLAVLTALNEQRLPRSRLIEHPAITYDSASRFGLTLGSNSLSNALWPVRLLDTLLASEVVYFAADHRHLRMQDTMTAENHRRVEWLHLGLMNFLYGNLFEKSDPGYDIDLGGGWYFRRD